MARVVRPQFKPSSKMQVVTKQPTPSKAEGTVKDLSKYINFTAGHQFAKRTRRA